ncbi:EH signature domain-containing protein [Rhizobium leguminosarum]|uniref:EH signature domain-containing protein n=1 Tax=Rhizobium leguminosarum TaxID=384 RepID=UPI0021BC0E4A|nr:EH signature domain-containing protein [Rhizobium leguminosarum]
MGLLEKLRKSAPFEAPALPAINRLASAAERVLSRWPDAVGNPPERDREKLVAEVNHRLAEGDWTETPMSLVTSAARALFDEERRERPTLENLRRFYYDECRASTRMGFIGAMISVYISSYVPGSRHSLELAEALESVQERLRGRWKQLLEHLPEVLDAFVGHAAVARTMLDMDDPWNDLKAIGMRSPHAMGLMDYAHIEYMKGLTPALKEREGMNRLFGWLKPERQEAKLSGAAEAISACLGHWTQSSPPEDDQRYLLENLIGLYGDPRVHRGGAWTGVSEPLMRVILSWLTRENIRFFLDIVSEVEESHMWEPRRKFWLGLHQQGRIEAAWVAFSDRARFEAIKRSKASGSRGTLGFGRQIAGYSRANTSLLILQVGRKIVVEGSHSYKVHIFNASDPRAPTLYNSEYDCERIRLLPNAKTQSHLGYWEGWVLENI